MASQPSARNPPAPSSSISSVRKCIVLFDWWLERMYGKVCISGLNEMLQMSNGALSSQRNKKSPARAFKCVVAKRYHSSAIETVKGYLVLIKGPLNGTRMCENGFSQKVCRSFMGGFPVQWKQLADSKMEQMDEHPESSSNSDDDALEEYHYKKFMSGDFVIPKQHILAENLDPFRNLASSDLGEPVTPNLGEPVTPNFCKAVVKFDNTSEENQGRKLRSGRVLSLSVETVRNSWKRTQQETGRNSQQTGRNSRKRMQQETGRNSRKRTQRKSIQQKELACYPLPLQIQLPERMLKKTGNHMTLTVKEEESCMEVKEL